LDLEEGSLIRMMAVSSGCKDGSKIAMDNGKYVRYTPEQVEALERLYHECPKPTSLRRQQLIRECPILSHIEPKQIKVWFQNRRYIYNLFGKLKGLFACMICVY
jgi:homeobox-leucine zipper protein